MSFLSISSHIELEKSFFARDTEKVAKDLLGCIIKKDSLKGKIVETEAYLADDPASHAYPRKTDRNRLMYETHGRIYVYLCYGIHYMLNFTAEKDGVGGILIRALEPLEGIEEMKKNRGVDKKENLCSGPGKTCDALNISKELNGTKIGEEIELKEGATQDFEASTRIGINKAQDRELRFYISGNKFVSQ